MTMTYQWKIVGLALLLAGVASAQTSWGEQAITKLRLMADPLFDRGTATEPRFDAFQAGMVSSLPPQAQAERALELAINRYIGASDFVLQRASDWHDQISETPALRALITTAINSPQIEVRMAGLEVHLAQYSLEKTSEEVDYLEQRLLDEPEHAGPWALWSMASIGARGVERERIFRLLVERANKDDDPLSVRHWAVDSLAKLGGAEVIEPLLSIAQSDTHPVVRERAFCGIAQSGMLHVAERYLAVPKLFEIAVDPQQSAKAKGWAYQALREITNLYDLPEEQTVWADQLVQLGLL